MLHIFGHLGRYISRLLHGPHDPAWILYDDLIDRVSVMVRAFQKSSLDKYDFFAISQYCSQLSLMTVKAGKSRVLACNLLINSRDEVYNVIQQMTAIFRGISYYGAGTSHSCCRISQLIHNMYSAPAMLLRVSFQYSGHVPESTTHRGCCGLAVI